MADSSFARRDWFRHNSGSFLERTSGDSVPVPYFARAAHCEAWFQTSASFNGSFTIYAVPTNGTQDASNIGIWVDGVFNQTVVFNVGANLNKQQAIVVNTGLTGARVIRIQEGERDLGVFLTRVVIDGVSIPAPSIIRQYTSYGDSVSMGAFASPRSSGWVSRLKNNGGSRFDSVTQLGRSGNSVSSSAFDASSRAARVAEILPTTANYVGSTENIVALCLSLNDWVTSAQSTTAATFQTNLAALVDALKTAADAQGVPGFKVKLHSMTHVFSTLQVANDKGSTPADFNTAIQAVATARPAYAAFIDLFNACNDADMDDGFIHPNATGHGKIYAAVVAAT